MSRLWHLRRQGRVLGPFPAGAIVADRLIGRINAQDELSPDLEQWNRFDQWPELVAAMAGEAPAHAEPEWLHERARARMRWADERAMAAQEQGADDRRTLPGAPHRAARASRPRMPNEAVLLKIAVTIAIATIALSILAWLYGAVNPVPVHLR
jgi:hypothetical protein